MRLLLLAYSLGLIAGTWVLSLMLASGLTAAALLVVALAWWCAPGGGARRRALALLSAALLGLGWHLLWAQQALQARLPLALEGQDLWLTGVVADLPTATGVAHQFLFATDGDSPAFGGRRVLLNDYDALPLVTGQHWRLRVRLNRPHGFANPGGFDYEAWLLQRGISAKGYVRRDTGNRLLGEGGWSWQRLRSDVRTRLLARAEQLPQSGVILALTVGDRSLLTDTDWRLMSATGTNHLFVISGLHIGLVSAAVYGLASLVLRALPTLTLWRPRQQLAATAALAVALLYSLLAGFTLPTQRAFVMTAVFLLGQLLNRPAPWSLRYLLALALVLTLNPLAALNVGFWLSFVAVGMLLVTLVSVPGSRQTGLAATGRRWLAPQVVVFVALAPLLAAWTGQLALLAPLINLVAIPVVGLFVVPLCLAGVGLLFVCAPLAAVVLLCADRVLGLVWSGLQVCAAVSSPWLLWQVGPVSMPALLCAVGAMLLVLTPFPWWRRWLCLPLGLPLLLPVAAAMPADEAQLHILDVGQGLAVIVQTAEHALVYDTGARLSPEFSLSTAVVLPVLRRLGIERLDALVISHFDNDHGGGLEDLLAAVPVARWYSSDRQQALARLRPGASANPALRAEACQRGQEWDWDGVLFRFLHPPPLSGVAVSANDNSCVLQIRFGEQGVLLPGDIERGAERQLVRSIGTGLGSDLLIAPHHGSDTSSSYPFLKQVRPGFVVFTAGYRNRFGHPASAVLRRYRELATRILVTHETGMLSFRLRRHGPLAPPRSFRAERPRYWY